MVGGLFGWHAPVKPHVVLAAVRVASVFGEFFDLGGGCYAGKVPALLCAR